MQPHDYALAYSLFRACWVALALLTCLVLWRRPRPLGGFLLVVGLHLVAWAAYRWPLVGSYGLPGNDRRFAMGTVACVAAGNSPADNLQVGVAALEPFWDVIGAALALFNPANVIRTYDWLTPLAILCVALGFYFGMRTRRGAGDGADGVSAWERVLVVFSVLGLSSFSLSNRTPIPPFFVGNFLLKPNHTMGYAVFALALGLGVGGAPFWILGLALGLLSWVFILHWAYAMPVFVLAELLRPRTERRWGRLVGAFGISLVLTLPQIANLARDYTPDKGTNLSRQMWQAGELGLSLGLPHWWTLDLGLLLPLAVVGVLAMLKRRSAFDRAVLGVVAFAVVASIVQALLVPFGVAPEMDELHYFLRLAAALAAAGALAALARHVESWKGLAAGRGYVLALAVCIPLAFPAYWDPPTMDRYFSGNILPLPPKIVGCTDWIRAHTRGDAVFVASFETASMIPALTGRRVLLIGDARPPRDYVARRRVARTLLRERDAEKVRQAAALHGVTHLVIDRHVREEYLVTAPASADAFDLAYRDRNVSIYALRGAGPGGANPPPVR
jgi:hypothetical protein